MFTKLFVFTDEQLKEIFDHFRALGVSAGIFAASDWILIHVGSLDPLVGKIGIAAVCFLIAAGVWLFLINQAQGLRKFKALGLSTPKLMLVLIIYNFVTITLFGSFFLH
jgi:hypothetical protein